MSGSTTGTTVRPDSGGARSAGDAGLQRMLKVAIVAMGVMVVAGLLTVIGRIVYLASQDGQQASTASGAIAPAARLGLPEGASVRSVALSGDRLAVHYDAPGGSGIAILDLASGRALSRVDIVQEPARR